jgi:hypothetical protein
LGINLLMLTSAFYMFQVYDRVLVSGSVETLLYLTLIALIALATLGLLDMIRGRADTFELDYFFGEGNPTVIEDFTRGEDLLVLNGADHDPILTNLGDLWTISFEDGGRMEEQSFQLVGVTSLDASDFSFVTVA